MLVQRWKRPVKKLVAVALHEDGWEIFNFAISRLFRVVLDVEPRKARLRKAIRECEETVAVLAANMAPGGAEAGDGHV